MTPIFSGKAVQSISQGADILNNLEERFSGALHSTARTWKIAVDRRLKNLGLSQASWTAIVTIAQSPKSMSQIELANRLGVEAATLVFMIDRLVKAGLVVREPSACDRRINLIILTKAGKEVFKKVKTEADILRNELLTEVDPKTLLAATELLEHLQHVAESAAFVN